ncbi:MAG: hypothetical protein ACP5IX_01375 [Patescibacteria group bacterium]
MNREAEKLPPEVKNRNVLERIFLIIKRVGKENLEIPKAKAEIEQILKNLFITEAQGEEERVLESYRVEMTKTIEGAREEFQRGLLREGGAYS